MLHVKAHPSFSPSYDVSSLKIVILCFVHKYKLEDKKWKYRERIGSVYLCVQLTAKHIRLESPVRTQLIYK